MFYHRVGERQDPVPGPWANRSEARSHGHVHLASEEQPAASTRIAHHST